MKSMMLRGVPMAMQRDGWWLNAPPPREGPPPVAGSIGPDGLRLGLLVTLIAMGDVLVWQVLPGLSLVVFSALLVLAALAVAGRDLSRPHLALVSGGTILALLPLVELVQPLSLLIAMCGLSVVLAFIAGLRPAELLRGALRLWPMGVVQGVQDVTELVSGGRKPGAAQRMVFNWMMPLGVGAAFAVLLVSANPIVEQWLGKFEFTISNPERLMFWGAISVLIWPVLSLPWMRERLRAVRAVPAARFGPPQQGLINPASVIRALILFNALFAAQTLLDFAYLYGGVGLPEGITFAKYAHRGAYPLVITALLAGGFALLTRRWTDGSVLLRGLLMLWVAQNVALVVSSLVRLELYVEAYGLTRLRMSAAIWMALVAVGLGLILWQVWQRRDNGWLMRRGAALGAATLYACCFISFDATIARFNLTQDVHSDRFYLCRLGEGSAPVIRARTLETGFGICAEQDLRVTVPQDWREWGFRNARTRRSLRAIMAEVPE